MAPAIPIATRTAGAGIGNLKGGNCADSRAWVHPYSGLVALARRIFCAPAGQAPPRAANPHLGRGGAGGHHGAGLGEAGRGSNLKTRMGCWRHHDTPPAGGGPFGCQSRPGWYLPQHSRYCFGRWGRCPRHESSMPTSPRKSAVCSINDTASQYNWFAEVEGAAFPMSPLRVPVPASASAAGILTLRKLTWPSARGIVLSRP